MKQKKILKYILGDTTQFIISAISCIVALVGILFMGGSFVASSKDKNTMESMNLNSEDKEGFSLYMFLAITSWKILKNYILYLTSTLFEYVSGINERFTIFVLPLIWVLCLPFLFPAMIILTVYGLFTENLKGNITKILLPMFNLSYFCGAEKKTTGWISSILLFLYKCMWFFITILLFCVNMTIINCVAGYGAMYFMAYTLIRPLQKYKEIMFTIIEYTRTIIALVNVVFLILSILYLGMPLRIASVVISIAVFLGLLYTYFRDVYENPEKYNCSKTK